MGKKRKNPQSAEASVKAKKVQKKQNSANGVLKERLVDIEIFENQTGPEILNSFLAPENPTDFFENVFQKKHKLIKRAGNEKFVRKCQNLFNRGEFKNCFKGRDKLILYLTSKNFKIL